jgi:hypothetical protein
MVDLPWMRRRARNIFLFSVSHALGRFKRPQARQIAYPQGRTPQRKASARIARMRRDANVSY